MGGESASEPRPNNHGFRALRKQTVERSLVEQLDADRDRRVRRAVHRCLPR
jgi:hypothetical protein